MATAPKQTIFKHILVPKILQNSLRCLNNPIVFLLCLGGASGLSSLANAQGVANSALDAKRFGAWEVTCPVVNGAIETAPLSPASQTSCRLSQRLSVKDSGQTVFALTVVKGNKKDDLVGIVSIPLGGYIAPGIEMRIDGKKTYKLLVETCNASGCHAGFPIPTALQKEWGRAKELSFRIWTAKAKPADIAVTLAGFNDGLKALRENTK